MEMVWLKLLLVTVTGTSHASRKEFHSGFDGQVDFVHNQLQSYRLRVGQDVIFNCQVKNIGDYKVAWLHSEKGIIAVHPDVLGQNERIKSTYDNRDSWSLSIKSVEESDAGKYICQVNTEIPVSISGTLNVEVPPDIIDQMSSSDTLVQEGRRVTLSCEARGVPKPTITWRREQRNSVDRRPELIRICNKTFNRILEKDEEICNEVQEYVGEVLELLNVNRFDSGVYLCIANNKVPPSVSKRVSLYVDFPPTLSVFHQLVGKMIGENVTLECLSSGHPVPFHFWKKNNNFISDRGNKYEIMTISQDGSDRNTFMKLTVINIQKTDFGDYQCQAKNSMGETSGNINLYEIESTTTTGPYYYHSTRQALDFIFNPEFDDRSKDIYQHIHSDYNEFDSDFEARTRRPKHHNKRKNQNTHHDGNGFFSSNGEGMISWDHIVKLAVFTLLSIII